MYEAMFTDIRKMVIRHALYDTWDNEKHSHAGPQHYTHCLEYLRQSIMCSADSNLEYRLPGPDGVKRTLGWNLHRCRDFDAMVRWSQEWRAFDGKIPSKWRQITDPDVLKGRVIDYS